MKLQKVLEALPWDLEWIVLFRLPAIRERVDPVTIRRMYFLPADTRLEEYSHVILTSAGRGLAPLEGDTPRPAGDPVMPLRRPGERSLWERHAAELEKLPADDADCLGFGAEPPREPAYLHLILNGGVGEATASLTAQPSRRHYDLLPAVGVDFVGGEARGGRYVARYRNRLQAHVHAGALSGFSRTANCNSFFFRHGEVDAELAEGLERAARDRVGAGRSRMRRAVRDLAGIAASRALPMTCHAPAPEPPSAYGDLVPLGFLLRALERSRDARDAFEGFTVKLLSKGLRERLDARREDGLWAFHSGRLVTATDSALVLLGVRDPRAVEALERFADGEGGYYPQLWSDEGGPGRMLADPCNRHWRQPDYATTCLVRGLRRECGLSQRTPLAWLAERFEHRSGLYFANPFLVDWCLAFALASDPGPDAERLRQRLRDEIREAARPDGRFGAFDVTLSTAFAILALAELGDHGRPVLAAQLRLLEDLEVDAAAAPCRPFYSTFLRPPGDSADASLRVGETAHDLSLYEDTHRVVFTAVVQMALGVDAVPDGDPAPRQTRAPHLRYGCGLEDYLVQFALPPYVGEPTGDGVALG